jgi:hypothetical protein
MIGLPHIRAYSICHMYRFIRMLCISQILFPQFQLKERAVSVKQISALILVVVCLCAYSSSTNAVKDSIKLDKASARLLGMWEIHMIKEPGKHYRRSYKGHPFVVKGPHAFTLIIQYLKDGSFKRIMRIGDKETVQEGKWSLAGHELRQTRPGNLPDEVMYIRFDGPDQFTSIEVYEACSDPGTFVKFKRINN